MQLPSRTIKVGVILIGLVAAFLGFRFITSYQELTIQIPADSGLTVSLYKTPNTDYYHDFEDFISEDSLVRRIETTQETFRVKKGMYVVESSGNDTFETVRELIEVGGEAVIYTLDPTYSADTLNRILAEEKEELDSLLLRTIPILKDYAIGDGQLFEKGNWYATTLRKEQTGGERMAVYADIYRVVLYKQGDAWLLATKPELALSQEKYPHIPRHILSSTNRFP